MAKMLVVNPSRRPTKRRPKRVAKKSRSTSLATVKSTTFKRYRRNPAIRRNAGMVEQFTKGAVGAAGALAVDIALQKLPLPAQLTANPVMKAATQGMIGIGLGMIMKKVGKASLGKSMAEGAVTVALYNAGKGVVGPTLGLSGMDDGLLGFSDFDDDLGYINPTAVSPWDDGDLNGFSEY